MPGSTNGINDTIEYHNSDRYVGELDFLGRPNGRGIYEFHYKPHQTQQGTYDGEWKHGNMDGIGTHQYRIGDHYEGPWKDDQRDGPNGSYTYYTSGSNRDMSERYIGEWENNKKHGLGVMIFTNGDKYDGNWVDGNMHAGRDEPGTYTFADGSTYVGTWKEDKRHGRGTLRYANGDVYDGDFENDLRHGQGKYTYQNGDAYEGAYYEDRKHGTGTYTYLGGPVCQVRYVNGELR